MGRRCLIVALVSAGLLSACRRKLLEEAPLFRRDLPGAAIDLPVGKDQGSTLVYHGGRVDLALPLTGSELKLQWRTGEMLSAEELEVLIVKPLAQSLGLSAAKQNDVRVAGGPGHRWVFRSDKRPDFVMVMSAWPCGKRFFSLTVGPFKGAERLERRVRDSFACKPDPAQDGRKPPITVQLPPTSDFGLVPDDNALGFLSFEGELVMFMPIAEHLQADDPGFAAVMSAILPAALGNADVTEVQIGAATDERGVHGARKVWRGQGKQEGEPVRLLASFIACDPGRYLGMYMGKTQLDEQRALRLLLDAQCVNAPVNPGLYQEVARAACAAGDRRACAP